MKLIHRIAYYLGGFVIGIIILLFFLGGKRASCDYTPTARTLKNIGLKKRVISEDAFEILRKNQLDTSAITNVLSTGDVLFSESNTQLDSCKVYAIEGEVYENDDRVLKIMVENCNLTATVLSAEVKKD
ncbi:MAG: hypothetical protein CMC08_06525 [Flavobacteriaceae bacterium]|nr:hypothetical protein [Flavobacteriaceae bacterium]